MTARTRLVVNLDLPGAQISRHLYGHFAEHLGRCIYGGFWVGPDSTIPNEGGIRLDVVEALRALRIPNLRWPGGCFADEYHWRDGIGPRDQRPRMVNSHWGDVVENNHFGTHEFMTLCELLGADPYVNGNVGSGSVREMSEWVEYLTRDDESPMATLRRRNGRDKAWRVPFWGIGNEPWGCGGNMRPEFYADLARQYGTFLRDHSGNALYKIAAGADASAYFWTETLMKAAFTGDDRRPLFDAVSFHYYTGPGPTWRQRGQATQFSEETYHRTMASALRVEELLTGHATVMDAYDPEKRLGLVLDEWGTWWDVEPGTEPGFLYQQNTMRDALVASVHFDAFHRHADRLTMANIAQTVNVLQSVILTEPESNQLVLTPTYHVFAMNVGHHDAYALPVDIVGQSFRSIGGQTIPTISASASTKDGKSLLSISNLDPTQEAQVILDLRGRAASEFVGNVLTSPDLASHNTAEDPDAVAIRQLPIVDTADGHGLLITIPAHSYATVEMAIA
jgi:alpha-N-arabinofuranosidase